MTSVDLGPQTLVLGRASGQVEVYTRGQGETVTLLWAKVSPPSQLPPWPQYLGEGPVSHLCLEEERGLLALSCGPQVTSWPP